MVTIGLNPDGSAHGETWMRRRGIRVSKAGNKQVISNLLRGLQAVESLAFRGGKRAE